MFPCVSDFSTGLERLAKVFQEQRPKSALYSLSKVEINSAKFIEQIRKMISAKGVPFLKSKSHDLNCRTWTVSQVQNWLSAEKLHFLSAPSDSNFILL